MIHIVSYTDVDESRPSAHRPREFTDLLIKTGHNFVLFCRSGAFFNKLPERKNKVLSNAPKKGGLIERLAKASNKHFGNILTVDRAMPWAFLQFPKIVFRVGAAAIRENKRQTVWATAPYVSNIYLAYMAALITRSHLHIDLRDLVGNMDQKKCSILFRASMNYAHSVSVVTDSLFKVVKERFPNKKVAVFLNGIAESAKTICKENPNSIEAHGWLRVGYAGAVYGGERPYQLAIKMLSEVSTQLHASWHGIRLDLAVREKIESDVLDQTSQAFKIKVLRGISRESSFDIAMQSHLNLLLVGATIIHTAALPLKTFDLLAVGRPILYVGPKQSETVRFLSKIDDLEVFFLYSDEGEESVGPLVDWISQSSGQKSIPKHQPSAQEELSSMLAWMRKNGTYSE